MNASDPDHGDGNELKVKGNGHRGPQTCSAASFVVLFNDIPLFTPIRFNNELNGMKRETSSVSVRTCSHSNNINLIIIINTLLKTALTSIAEKQAAHPSFTPAAPERRNSRF